MKFEEGDILVSRDTKIKIVGVSNKHYEYFYFDFVNPTIYTVCHHDIDDVCDSNISLTVIKAHSILHCLAPFQAYGVFM